MQPEPAMITADPPTAVTKHRVTVIGGKLCGLSPGSLAELRREAGGPDSPRPTYFWRLVTLLGIKPREEASWLRIIRIMAILTDKGDAEKKQSPHAPKSESNKWRGLGAALCDGGDRAWGAGQIDPRPMLSELRFARLLAAQGDMRGDLMERAARALAAKKSPGGGGVDCTDLARFLLRPDDPEPGRNLARSYYARLDRGQTNDAPDGATTGDDE